MFMCMPARPGSKNLMFSLANCFQIRSGPACDCTYPQNGFSFANKWNTRPACMVGKFTPTLQAVKQCKQ